MLQVMKGIFSCSQCDFKGLLDVTLAIDQGNFQLDFPMYLSVEEP